MLRPFRLVTDCGAELIVVPMQQVNSVALGVLVHAGTRDEQDPGESGLAHAHEHLVFRGNSKFPNSQELTGYLEKLGGEVNAATDKESTLFHALVPASRLKEGAEYLYHLVSTPRFDSRYIPPEMNNVIGEIKSCNDNPEELVGDLNDEVLYGYNSLKNPILGTVESVSQLTRSLFLRWQKNFYRPDNFSFIAAGNVRPRQALKAFNRFFRRHSHRPQIGPRVLRSLDFYQPKTKVVHKDVEQLHLSLAAPIGEAAHQSTAALSLFLNMIDGGMSFPLFQEIREKYGLGYVVNACLTPRSDIGVFKFYLGIDPANFHKALRSIFRIIRLNSANKKLFNETKEMVIGHILLDHERTDEVLNQVANDLTTTGKAKPDSEIIRTIKETSLAEVSEAVGKYLQPERFTKVMIAPKGFQP